MTHIKPMNFVQNRIDLVCSKVVMDTICAGNGVLQLFSRYQVQAAVDHEINRSPLLQRAIQVNYFRQIVENLKSSFSLADSDYNTDLEISNLKDHEYQNWNPHATKNYVLFRVALQMQKEGALTFNISGKQEQALMTELWLRLNNPQYRLGFRARESDTFNRAMSVGGSYHRFTTTLSAGDKKGLLAAAFTYYICLEFLSPLARVISDSSLPYTSHDLIILLIFISCILCAFPSKLDKYLDRILLARALLYIAPIGYILSDPMASILGWGSQVMSLELNALCFTLALDYSVNKLFERQEYVFSRMEGYENLCKKKKNYQLEKWDECK